MEAEKAKSDSGFFSGLTAGIPIALGYIPVAITFGMVAKAAGIPNHIAILMSLVVFAGASQFIGVKLVSLGVTPWEIVATTFILNFRHFLMSSSLSQRLHNGVPRKWLALMSFGITDESFTVASLRSEKKLSLPFLLGLNLIGYSSWVAGTVAGVFMAGGIPDSVKTSMGIALYAMFIGLLVPALRDSRPALVISLLAVATNTFISWNPFFAGLSAGWCIIITTILTAAAGALLYPAGADSAEARKQ